MICPSGMNSRHLGVPFAHETFLEPNPWLCRRRDRRWLGGRPVYPGLPGRPPAARPQIHPSGCRKPRWALSFALGTSCPLCMAVLAFICNLQWVPVVGQCRPSSEDIFLEGRVGLLVRDFFGVFCVFLLLYSLLPCLHTPS